MADDFVTLLEMRGFSTIDRRSSPHLVAPGNAVSASNVDTHRQGGALRAFFGRQELLTFSNLQSDITTVARYDVGPSRQFFIVQADTQTAYWDVQNNLRGSLTSVSGAFTMSVQANGILWLNNGQQIFYGADGALHVASWQYPAPQQGIYNVGDGGAGTLPAATYYYAFAQVITLPTPGGGTQQITTPVGADVPYPYTYTSDGAHQAALAGAFAGTTPDGYPYVTQVFRQSSLVPVWYLLTTIDSNTIYYDNADDDSITGNEQITPRRDPPPTGGTNGLNPIAELNNSVWVLATQNNVATQNVPQTQLWYSEVGQPWSFDAVNRVELVGSENATLLSQSPLPPAPDGEQPIALAPVGSYLFIAKSLTTWLNTGVNETTYQAYPLFNDIACIAPQSLMRGNGLVFWLSAQGIFSYDGSSLQYLSDQIYNDLQGIAQSHGMVGLASCVAFYGDLTAFFSFPDANITYAYYLPKKEWTSLPYATPAVAYNPNLPSTPLSTGAWKVGQIVAARGQALDAWMEGENLDLGVPPTLTWVGPIFDSGAPYIQKDYRWIMLEAPPQPTLVTVSLSIDPSPDNQGTSSEAGPVVSYTFDCTSGPPTQFYAVPQESCRGYTAQITISAVSTSLTAVGPEIWGVSVGGVAGRPWTPRTT